MASSLGRIPLVAAALILLRSRGTKRRSWCCKEVVDDVLVILELLVEFQAAGGKGQHEDEVKER